MKHSTYLFDYSHKFLRYERLRFHDLGILVGVANIRLIVAVGGWCMTTNECSEGGELLATGQLSNSSHTLHHIHPTHL